MQELENLKMAWIHDFWETRDGPTDEQSLQELLFATKNIIGIDDLPRLSEIQLYLASPWSMFQLEDQVLTTACYIPLMAKLMVVTQEPAIPFLHNERPLKNQNL